MEEKKTIKVAVSVGSTKLMLTTTEKSEYIKKISKTLSDCVNKIMRSDSEVSYNIALILAGLNFVDEIEKNNESSSDLRKQVLELIEENTKLRKKLEKEKRLELA